MCKTPSVEVQSRLDPEDLQGNDPESLDPSRYYRWAHERSVRQQRLRSRGIKPVSREEDGVRLLVDNEQGAAEDLIRNVDLILVSCPKDLHEERRKALSRATHARVKKPEGSFRKKARSALTGGVKVVDDQDKEPI